MNEYIKNNYPLLIILVVALLSFFPFLGAIDLFDWDEINFAEISREMILLNDYGRIHIDFVPFFEKTPLYFWLQAVSMQMFGINEFAARLPNALCSLFCLYILYKIGSNLKDKQFGFLWALAYLASFLPHLYFKTGIIDPWFNLFIFLGLHHFIQAQQANLIAASETNNANIALILKAGLFFGLAMLTKGPVGILIPGLTVAVFWVSERFSKIHIGQSLLVVLLSLFVFGFWILFEFLQNGPDFVLEFFKYQYRLFSTEDAGHGGFPGYHVFVLLFGCFPASFFMLQNVSSKNRTAHNLMSYRKWMIILGLVIVILFSVVQSKIVHYSSLAYYPITFLAALSMHDLLSRKKALPKVWTVSLISFCTLIIIIAISFPLIIGNTSRFVADFFPNDLFANATALKPVNWGMGDMANAIFLLVGLILFVFFQKKGKNLLMVLSLFGGSLLFMQATIYTYPKKIAQYTQATAIDFYQKYSKQGIDLIPMGFKTYAHLFYGSKDKDSRPGSVLKKDTSKHQHFIIRADKEEQVKSNPDYEFIERSFGYAIYLRKANN